MGARGLGEKLSIFLVESFHFSLCQYFSTFRLCKNCLIQFLSLGRKAALISLVC